MGALNLFSNLLDVMTSEKEEKRSSLRFNLQGVFKDRVSLCNPEGEHFHINNISSTGLFASFQDKNNNLAYFPGKVLDLQMKLDEELFNLSLQVTNSKSGDIRGFFVDPNTHREDKLSYLFLDILKESITYQADQSTSNFIFLKGNHSTEISILLNDSNKVVYFSLIFFNTYVEFTNKNLVTGLINYAFINHGIDFISNLEKAQKTEDSSISNSVLDHGESLIQDFDQLSPEVIEQIIEIFNSSKGSNQ